MHIHIYTYIYIYVYRMFYHCWNKAEAIFPIVFILFLFADYCWKIVNILIYLTKCDEIIPWSMKLKIFVWRHITKLSLLRLFKQDIEGSSDSTHFQTGVRFSKSRTLKFMAFMKISGEKIPVTVTIQTSKNVTRFWKSVSQSLSRSLQWRSQILRISVLSVQCILTQYPKLFLDWIQILKWNSFIF